MARSKEWLKPLEFVVSRRARSLDPRELNYCWIGSWPWTCVTRQPTVTRSWRAKGTHRRGYLARPLPSVPAVSSLLDMRKYTNIATQYVQSNNYLVWAGLAEVNWWPLWPPGSGRRARGPQQFPLDPNGVETRPGPP